MNYQQLQRKFKKKRMKRSLNLLRATRINFMAISSLDYLVGVILKIIIILLGFQFDIYMKLRDVTYDNSYLDSAKVVENQIRDILNSIGD